MNATKKIKSYARHLKALLYGFRHPTLLKNTIANALDTFYFHEIEKRGALPSISIEELVKNHAEIKISNLPLKNGNVSPLELLLISSLIESRKPLNLLEIGTFDGTTTLEMAFHSPEEAIVHTIDLEEGQTDTFLSTWEEDLKFILDTSKTSRKFMNSPLREKIVQHLGDSTCYDFSKFISERSLDFCFIDAGHSYECVKSDTENTLQILAEKALVLWHDFNPRSPGVYTYLLELSKTLPIKHIAGTNLAIYEKG